MRWGNQKHFHPRMFSLTLRNPARADLVFWGNFISFLLTSDWAPRLASNGHVTVVWSDPSLSPLGPSRFDELLAIRLFFSLGPLPFCLCITVLLLCILFTSFHRDSFHCFCICVAPLHLCLTVIPLSFPFRITISFPICSRRSLSPNSEFLSHSMVPPAPPE